MKYILLFVVSIIFFNSTNAQNWAFIQENERYHFQHDDDTLPLNTIFADSVTLSDVESKLHLNRLFLPCDTCNEEGFYLDNQPGFLQRSIIVNNNESTITLLDPDSLTILLKPIIGNEWWFNAEETLKAKVSALESTKVFGIADSIMTICIDNEPKIKISKSYGLIEYFDYKLSGLENAGMGYCLPGFKEIYDFEVGDVFMYKRGYECWLLGPEYCEHYLKKSVKSVIVENNNAQIIFDTKSIKFDEYAICSQYEEKEDIFITTENSYPNEKIVVDLDGLIEDTLYSYTKMNYRWNSISKNIGVFVDKNENQIYRKLEGNLFEKYYDMSLLHYNLSYTEGLGKTSDQFEYFEAGYNMELIGCIKNGDTIGEVFSDDFMMTINEKENTFNTFNLYPNPSKSRISFDLGMEEFAQIEIIQLSGKKIYHFETNNTAQHDVNSLPEGLYFVQITTPNKQEIVKWVKE